MRKTHIALATLLVVFSSAGFTQPGCTADQKQQAVELVERGAFLAFSIAFGKELDRFSEALQKEGDTASPDLVEPIGGYVVELRRLKDALGSASLSDLTSLGNLARSLSNIRRNLSCDLELLPEGKLKTLLANALERAGPWVDALARFLPNEEGGDRSPANLTADVCP